MNNAARQYLNELNRYLPGKRKNRKQLSDIELSVTNYSEEFNITNYLLLVKHFGEPMDVAGDFLEKPQNIKSRRTAVLLVFMLLVISAFTSAFCTLKAVSSNIPVVQIESVTFQEYAQPDNTEKAAR